MKEKHLKRIFLFSSLILVGSLFSRQYSCQNKQTTIKKVEKQSNLISDRITTRKSSVPLLLDYASHFNYYVVNINNCPYIVADVFEPKNHCVNLCEVKVILQPKNYSFDGYDDLKDKEYVIEFISINSLLLTKTFYVPNENEVLFIKEHAVQLEKNQSNYSNIITSLNAEADFKASLSLPMQGLNTVSYSTNSVENQAILDEYLLEDTLSCETTPIQIGAYNGNYQTMPMYDDTIVNLIPKLCFQNEGVYSKGGSEWGYFVKTYKDTNASKISSVLIYDIKNNRTYGQNADTVDIRTVLHRNYKYDANTNLVQKDVVNNYCLGNPTFEYGLKYDTLSNSNITRHPNYGDSDYNVNLDEGYALDSSSISYTGVGKNSDNKNVGALNQLLGTIGGAVVTYFTQGLSIGAQVAVGVAVNTVINGVTDVAQKETTVSTVNGKRVFNDVQIKQSGNLTNLRDRAKAIAATKGVTDPNKISLFNHITLSDNQSDADKNAVPFLFKDQTDVIHYSCTYLSSDRSFDYVAQFIHNFHAEVINDNSVWLFKWNPDHVSTISAGWVYHIGEKVQCDPEIINASGNSRVLTFGRDTEQTVQFTPSVSGNYKFILSDYPSYTYLSGNGHSFDSSEITVSGICRPKQEEIVFTDYLTANKTYTYKVGRRYYLFGQAHLQVYMSGSNISMGSSSTTHVEKNINYQGFSMSVGVTVLSDGIYTFTLPPKEGSSISDTYISLLDNQYRTVLCDDDGFGNLVSGLSVYLHANETYHLICRPFSPFSKGEMLLEAYKYSMLPDFKTIFPYNTIVITDFNTTKLASFITTQTTTTTITFSASLNYTSSTSSIPVVSLKIKDSTMKSLSLQSNILQSSLSFTFEKDKLYVIELSSTDLSMIGGISVHLS